MKKKLHLSKKAIYLLTAIVSFFFISAGLKLITGGVDYTTPAAGHFVSPLSSSINWGPIKNIRAFFPAQANLQWLSGVAGYTDPVGGSGTMAAHPGASSVQFGTGDCRSCHESNLNNGTFAANLVNGPKGIVGKDPYKDLEIQAAFDSNYLYVKVAWESQNSRPGVTHQIYQYRGGTWYGDTKNKTSAINEVSQLTANQFFSYEDRLALQIAPTTLGENIKAFGNAGMNFTQGGCFVACHSSMREMTKEPTSTEIQADPWLGAAGLNVSDLRHYLLHTRGVNAFADADATGNWQTTVSGYNQAQQTADMNNGKFIDLIQYRAARSAAMYGNSNDIILEYRNSGIANTNKGDNYWFNQNPAAAQPANVNQLWYDVSDHQWKDSASTIVNVGDYRWMYDSLITGFNALPADALDTTLREMKYNWTVKFPLITRGPDRNAVPLDMSKINEGDFLPKQPLREGTGIRGAVDAFSEWDSTSNKWTVIIRRPLNKTGKCDHGNFGTYCSDHDLRLEDLQSGGQGITIGMGIFDWYASNRYHYVTFPYHLQASATADIIAVDNSLTGIEWVNDKKSSLLEQNYPNPFTKTTQIKYTLTESNDVKLEIYDVYGRVVKTLVNKYQSAGIHTVTWDAQNLSKGVYFYQIQSGKFKQSKRALVIK